jgi:hypothetical protein
MKIKNKYKNHNIDVFQQTFKGDKSPAPLCANVSKRNKLVSGNATLLGYKKKNRKSLRITFRNLTLSGFLVGINKI